MSLLLVKHTLTVRRVTKHCRTALRICKLGNITPVYLDIFAHTCLSRIVARKSYRLWVDIKAVQLKVFGLSDISPECFSFLVPQLFGQELPLHRGKLSVKARRDIQRLERALDKQCTASAERIADDIVVPYPRKVGDTRRKRFLYRCGI